MAPHSLLVPARRLWLKLSANWQPPIEVAGQLGG